MVIRREIAADGAVSAAVCRVLLVEPNAVLRSAIVDVLGAEDFQVELCQSLNHAVSRSGSASDGLPQVALVAWQCMDRLLADGHRDLLSALNHRVPLVIMVPRRWERILAQGDLRVAGLIAKPLDVDQLLYTLRSVSLDKVD
jgi:DNA-binding response OmpR family regulator